MSFKPADLHGGCSYCLRRKKHRAKVWIRSESHHLGWYKTAEEAQLVYETAIAMLLAKPKLPVQETVSPERTAQIQYWVSQLFKNILPDQPVR